MGRGIVESGLFRSERYQLEQRTSDPATTQEGDMWIRTDLAPDTNQLATLRFANGGGTIDIPIYDVAASAASKISKAWRVQTGGVTGFVPILETSGTYDQLRIQRGSNWWGTHDSLSAISDPVDHYDELLYEDKGNTLSDYYGGDLSVFSRQTATALQGTHALEGGSNPGGRISSTSGLPRYPDTGETFRFDTQFGDERSSYYFLWATTDETNSTGGYGARIDDNTNVIGLYRFGTDGSVTKLQTSSTNLDSYDNTQLTGEIQWGSSGGLTFDLLDANDNSLNSVSATDTTYTDGGIGVRDGGPGTTPFYIDNIRIV